MKAFEKWYENIGIELFGDCLYRLPKGVAKKTWKAALKWMLKEMNDFPTITVDVALCWKDIIKEELKD